MTTTNMSRKAVLPAKSTRTTASVRTVRSNAEETKEEIEENGEQEGTPEEPAENEQAQEPPVGNIKESNALVTAVSFLQSLNFITCMLPSLYSI